MKDTETVTLDEILTEYGARRASKYYKFKVGESEDYDEEAERLKSEAKAAIHAYFERVIEEAKPPVIDTPSRIKLYADDEGQMWYDRGQNDAIERYEQNLKQALSTSGKVGG